MFGNLKSNLKSRIKGVVEDIKGRRVDAADPYVAAPPVVTRPPVPARPQTSTPVPTPSTQPITTPGPPPIAATPPAPEPAVAEPVVAEPVVLPDPVLAAPVEPPAEPAVAETPVAAVPIEAPAPVSAAQLAAAAATGKVTSRVLHADMGSTDVASYVARAKANGRSVDSVTGGEGRNVAEDGTAFWGPVDNDSSRAKAAGKLLTIDQFECISCGTCVEQTDKVYYLPDDGKATPIAQDGPMDLIQDAIDACPVTCIHWTTREEAEERGLATGE